MSKVINIEIAYLICREQQLTSCGIHNKFIQFGTVKVAINCVMIPWFINLVKNSILSRKKYSLIKNSILTS